MTTLNMEPRKLKGKVNIPPSKSLSHRAIICASLCKEEGRISNVLLSEDIKATIEGMRVLGASIKIEEVNYGMKDLYIKNEKEIVEKAVINCRESGSTLRFLIPLALVKSYNTEFLGSGKLVERPLTTYYNMFKEKGIYYENNKGKLPLILKQGLESGEFLVNGDVSSQFISGLLFVLPMLKGDSKIRIKNHMESKAYVDLTINIMKKFGVNIENREYKEFYIKGSQEYKAFNYEVEGDFSQGAFFLVAEALGNEIQVQGLDYNSLQGDKEIARIIKIITKNPRRETTIDASQIPDLVPIMAVLASLKLGKTSIINAGRLRIKESDRLKAICKELKKLGANIEENGDGLIIYGKEELEGGSTVHSWNDHRIAMSLAIAATKCKKPLILEESESVNKSYPHFWEHYKSLGGLISE